MNKIFLTASIISLLVSIQETKASDRSTGRLRGSYGASPASPGFKPTSSFGSISDGLSVETDFSGMETARTVSPSSTRRSFVDSPSSSSPLSVVDTVRPLSPSDTRRSFADRPSSRSSLPMLKTEGLSDGMNLHRLSERTAIYQNELNLLLNGWKDSWDKADVSTCQTDLKAKFNTLCNAFISTNDFYLISYFISHSPKILLKELSREQVEALKLKVQAAINIISETANRSALENALKFKHVFELQEFLKDRPSYRGIDILTTANERIVRSRMLLSEQYRSAVESAEGRHIDLISYWKEPTTPEELLVNFHVLKTGLETLIIS